MRTALRPDPVLGLGPYQRDPDQRRAFAARDRCSHGATFGQPGTQHSPKRKFRLYLLGAFLLARCQFDRSKGNDPNFGTGLKVPLLAHATLKSAPVGRAEFY